MEKTFADGGKIAKFVKVFSLESFPLYGMSRVYTHASQTRDVAYLGHYGKYTVVVSNRSVKVT